MDDSVLKNEKTIFSIQALRGIAALLVVFAHAEQYVGAFLSVHMKKYIGPSFGAFGVDIFFVISGFIMAYINRDNFGKKNAVWPFLARRFTRIYPIYWLVTLFVLLVIFPSGIFAYALPESEHAVIHMTTNVDYLVKCFLLLPYYDASGQIASPVVGVAWTLIYEMFFYVIFSAMLFLDKKIYFRVLTCIFLALIAGRLVLVYANSHFNMHYFIFPYVMTYGSDLILEFIFGSYLASRYLSGKMLSNKVALFVIVLSCISFFMLYHIPQRHWWELRGIAIFSLFYHIKSIGVGIPAAFLIYGLLSLESNEFIKISSFFIWLGDASYSIYLTHFSIALVILLSLLKKINSYSILPGDVMVFMVWVLCVGVGCLVYRYVELPLTRAIKQWSYTKPISIVSPIVSEK